MSDWTCYVVETFSGRVVDEVPLASAPSYSRLIGDKGSWSVSIAFSAMSATRKAAILSECSSWRFSFCIAMDNFIVQGGPIVHRQWGDSAKTLTVSGLGMRAIFDKRLLKATNATDLRPESADVTLKNVTWNQAVKLLILQGMAEPYCGLPIDLPPDDIAGVNNPTYKGYDLAYINERLTNIEHRIGGPDIDFHPFFTVNGDYVRWLVRVGTPLGRTDLACVLDYPGPVLTIDTDSNGEKLAEEVWVKGSGDARDSLIASTYDQTLLQTGYPALDYFNTEHTDVVDPNTLNDYAAYFVALYKTPVETWGVTLRMDSLTKQGLPTDAPKFGDFLPGDQVVFNVQTHDVVMDGAYTQRVLGWTQGSRAGDAVLVLQSFNGVY